MKINWQVVSAYSVIAHAGIKAFLVATTAQNNDIAGRRKNIDITGLLL